ncbi:CAF17-like 4Fe-4S cluster assembly/insertion protein YgfZ [Methylocystis suflitae]|uniref:CAF17-like 4Fe-4S cluster assembly/insertion protein YgfZ n=1 Tax=Methylocystis suflitae TaxID=2951405 RepID=UPI0021089A45|nr:folate-binding protein [Methylocystis suflitae]MCQ4188011.1 folate-binding protein [Methylocystis suflitae]
MTTAILLDDRAIIEIAGEDAGKFLHNLVTNDVASLKAAEARFAALLTPQGKILFDFLVFAAGEGGYLLDCPLALSADLEKRLNIYKLRSKVTVTNRSSELDAIAFPDLTEAPKVEAVAIAADPRGPLGFRAIAAKGKIPTEDGRSAYEARRIHAGVPLGGVDFDYGATFPHEANMDLLSGLDFKKGCYVGQEVVSRMKHRGLVRKRITKYRAQGGAPAPGEAIRAGDVEIGVTGSRLHEEGLAMVRLDRLGDALAAGATPVAAGAALSFEPDAAPPT